MKIIHLLAMQVIICTALLMLKSCTPEEQSTLTVSPTTVQFPLEGGTDTLTVQTNAPAWQIQKTDATWLQLSDTSGANGQSLVLLSIATKTIEARTDTLTITAGNALPVQVVVTQPASEYLYSLQTDKNQLQIPKAGAIEDIAISTDAPFWTIVSDADWLKASKSSGYKGNTTVQVTASKNDNNISRTALLTLKANHAPPVEIVVKQLASLYPAYNTSPLLPDATGMGSSAAELASKIKLGWNIGNSLEAIGSETAWGNPKVSKELIGLIKKSGFNAVRIPCSWNQYLANSANAQIKTEWLDRVKEVVQYCIDHDMYVLLNIHWDGGWLENNCTVAKQVENNAKQKAFWEQIATHLRDFDERLMFAGTNEPNVENATQMSVLHSYLQTFIDAVRSTGGRNSYRVLVVQGPSTDIDKTNKLMLSLPTDPTPNRMMVEIHYYTPWNFCGLTEDASWGKMFYYWGKINHSTTDPTRNATWGEENELIGYFKKMKTQFVDKGIPVVLGEYSATRRLTLTGDNLTRHLASRAYWTKTVTKQAKLHGMLPFYWDNGGTGNDACGIFDRHQNKAVDQLVLDALIQGINE
jgi:aryl-phospho-beta-D-glucosidase BglC (GH1 family)